jgi:hypothetical protein
MQRLPDSILLRQFNRRCDDQNGSLPPQGHPPSASRSWQRQPEQSARPHGRGVRRAGHCGLRSWGRTSGGRGVGVPGVLEVSDGVVELGALAHLVELALASQARLEKLPGLLGLHALPVPLGDAARVRARSAARG